MAGVPQDLVGDVYGSVFAFEGVTTMAEDFLPLASESFYLGWQEAGRENKDETEEGTDKVFVAKKLNLLGRWDVVFDDRS